MMRWLRQSLLGQVLGTYLLFVAVVLGMGVAVNVVVQQQLRASVEASDLALAQALALQIGARLEDARESLAALATLARTAHEDRAALIATFEAFMAARPDVDRVYWLDPAGSMRISVPANVRTLGVDYSDERVFLRAREATAPFVEGGSVDLTTYNAVATIAAPVRDETGALLGIVATNIALAEWSAPLRTIVEQQAAAGQRLTISVLDERGLLIAAPTSERLLQPLVTELAGAAEALAGQQVHRRGAGPRGEDALFSAVPVPGAGWAVVAQRPVADALAVVRRFNTWLTLAALLFAAGGLLFWLLLMRRVIQPLHLLAAEHRALPPPGASTPSPSIGLERRPDEVGHLARSLRRLERDVQRRLAELRTLLETSNAVVGTLEPQTVARTIIREVRRLADVQAVSVLVPDDEGALNVLASAGLSEGYDRSIHIRPDDPHSPSALALREGRPVQLIAGGGDRFPSTSYAEGFRALLAIPIISRHAGEVVLVVYRRKPQPFTPDEMGLLLTFANYATLAWEHAVLYEHTDERLQEVARENERLYWHAMHEKQTLAALIGSMSDGLVLASSDGGVLYANPGAAAIIGLPMTMLERSQMGAIHATLRALSPQPEAYDRAMAHAQSFRRRSWLLETTREQGPRAVELRLFDVQDETAQPIGQGLLLRDVTRERELDQFKTTLLAAVGHELRTPLAAIKGHASTLLQEDVQWPPHEQRHFLRTISAEADRLAQLVSNLLDLSRFEAGLLPLNRAPQPVGVLVESAARRVNPPIPELLLELPDDLPLVDVDGARITVVLRNLLSNAVAYGEGRVLVTATARGQDVVVRVSDNGPGIVADELPYVFERFFRAQRGRERRSGGTGLGLAICKAFVEAHGGTIWAENGSGGATIALTLPIVAGSLQVGGAHDFRGTSP